MFLTLEIQRNIFHSRIRERVFTVHSVNDDSFRKKNQCLATWQNSVFALTTFALQQTKEYPSKKRPQI